MDVLYRLTGIRQRRESAVALSIDDLGIPEGRACFLVGPNGSGKSTLLSLLAFLCRPTSGEMFYGGERVGGSGRPPAAFRREVTLLHQSPYLFHGTVEDNVGFGLKVRGIRGEAQRSRIAESLEAVGLKEFGRRRARALSGGEAQRVAMARALALRPRVLLLDEPLAHVDRETAAVLAGVMAALPASGTTVITATHDPSLPGGMGGEVVRLEGGRVVATTVGETGHGDPAGRACAHADV